jgi:hypothetical protein
MSDAQGAYRSLGTPVQPRLYPPRPLRQPVPSQAHRVGQGHGVGEWWEPAAALTCTSLLTASDVLPNLGDIFKISETEVQKGLAGLLPGQVLFPLRPLLFLWDSFAHTSTRPPTPARRTTRPPASAG